MIAARRMVQAHGYNALSFRELAKEVGIKSASIHYHFPTKGDLGAALARRYTDDGSAYLEHLFESTPDQETCFQRYTEIFRTVLLEDNRMCLYGIMAAEYDDLPVEVRAEIDRFNQTNIHWLSKVLARRQPEADPDELRQRALAIFAAIEGAQLVARGRGDIAVFDAAIAAYRAVGLIP